MKPETRNRIAILAGFAVLVATAALLFPLLKTAVINSYTISLSAGLQVSRIKLSIISLLWIGFSAFVAGFFTCWMAASRNIFRSLQFGMLLFVMLVILQLFLQRFQWADMFTLLIVIPFAVMGGIVRTLISNNKLPD